MAFLFCFNISESRKDGDKMVLQSVSIKRLGSRAFLEIGNSSVEIQDYKISSSMQGGTELEMIFEIKSSEIMEFELEATKASFRLQSLKAKNDDGKRI